MYLEYSDYEEMGGKLEETTFENFEFEAECLVDYYTFNRLKNDNVYPEALKRLIYALINLAVDKSTSAGNTVVNADNTTSQVGITSQSNDGVSISYNVLSASQLYENYKPEVIRLIQQYLQGLTNSLGRKLLYRGLYPGE